jgi:hypothetical protein
MEINSTNTNDFNKSESEKIIEEIEKDKYDSNLYESIDFLKQSRDNYQKQLTKYRLTWWGWLLSAITGIGIFWIFSDKIFGESISQPINYIILMKVIVVGSFAGAFFYFYFIFSMKTTIASSLRNIKYKLIQSGADELKEKIDDNFFSQLVKINFKYLDQYYLQTQEQAEKSFRLSSAAAIIGLFIVIAGIIMMFFNKTEPAYVTTGAGVISEFIASVFFYLYNRTILKMSQYHQKLVLTQNISLALKITDEMDKETKSKSLELLIDRLSTDINKYLVDNKE